MLAMASSLAAAFAVGHGAIPANAFIRAPATGLAVPSMMSSPLAQAGEEDDGCELIGEEVATGTEWWKCEEPAEAAPGATCKSEEFGTGGGPGILPQDGQVLCKVEKPQGPLGFIQTLFSQEQK